MVDPPGSSLFLKVTRGVLYTREEAEGKRLRNPFDTITEGIGLNRLTANFSEARVDGAFRGSDREAVEMAAYLLRNEGLFLGRQVVYPRETQRADDGGFVHSNPYVLAVLPP